MDLFGVKCDCRFMYVSVWSWASGCLLFTEIKPIIHHIIFRKEFYVLIKDNFIGHLTAPVKWTQSVQNMVADGAKSFVEVGPGKVLQGLVRKIDGSMETSSAQLV